MDSLDELRMNGCILPEPNNLLISPLLNIITEPHHKSMSAPPGPRGPPLIGQAFNLDTSHMHIKFMEWQKMYGDLFMFKVLGKHYLVISHPDIMKKMFVTCEHARRFNDKPASFMGSYVIEQTKDIVFRNCDEKQQFLKCAARDYVENTVRQEQWFYESVCCDMELAVNEINAWKDKPVDILNILDKCATRVMGLLLSGHSIHNEDPEYASLTGFMATGNELGTVKNQTILTAIPAVRKLPGHLKEIYETIVDNRDHLKKSFITDNTGSLGLVALLKKLGKDLSETKGDDWLLDESFILGIIMDFAAAAIVPLQNTLSVLFLVLTHHPKIQAKIRHEMEALTSHPTINDMDRMPYTAACMLELKRFHTPLPISARHCNRSGDVKFEKYNIPKNTEIFTNMFGMHHDERFWEDPWSFKPERFLTADGTLVPDDSPVMRNLVVTGVGPRACVGSKFSENVLFLAATSILQKFAIMESDTDILPSCDPRSYLPGVVLRAPNFKVCFKEVKTGENTNS